MSTLRKYTLSNIKGEGWAIFVIDTSIGYFSVVSDYGNYAYRWTHPGCEFREFLVGCNPDYVWSKIVSGRQDATVYDEEATRKCILEVVKDLDEERRKEEEELLGRGLEDEESFREWCRATSLECPWEYHQTRPEGMSWGFVTRVLPRFQAVLRKELEEEEHGRLRESQGSKVP